MDQDFIKVDTENDLNRLPQLWLVPAAPQALAQSVTNSFLRTGRRQFGFASPRNKPARPEVLMKRCNACQEEFADKFSFCPVDGSPLNALAAALAGKAMPGDSFENQSLDQVRQPKHCSAQQTEFRLTTISTRGLWFRLTAELSFVIVQLRQAWPEFKREPITFGKRALNKSMAQIALLLRQPNALAGTVTALLLVMSAVLTLVLYGRIKGKQPAGEDTVEVIEMLSLNLPPETPMPEGVGVGAGSNGRVGLSRGSGEGSEAAMKPAHGGGGSGDLSKFAARQGKVPPPAEIPAPIRAPLAHASLPAAGVDLDPALWQNLPFVAYGDPRSKATAVANGPGSGGVVGSGDGLGDGSGHGNGVGPGDDGNAGGGKKNRGGIGPGGAAGNEPRGVPTVYRISEVTQRAKVISKPEPQYTEAARKNQVTGSVVLSVIFSQSGEVTSIRPVKLLPDGLTEKAITAARQIRFVPAMRDGQAVSVYMQLEYNFNLY